MGIITIIIALLNMILICIIALTIIILCLFIVIGIINWIDEKLCEMKRNGRKHKYTTKKNNRGL